MPVALRLLLIALFALIPAAPAAATHPSTPFPLMPQRIAAPLEGEGENMKIVANLDLGGGAEEIELAGDFAYLTGPEGLHIVDISNPLAPKQVSSICQGGFGDVGINSTATIAILAADGNAGECVPADATGNSGVVVVDISNKRKPVFQSFIAVPQGAHTATLDNDVVIINQYDQNYRKAEFFSIADPKAPKLIATVPIDGTAFHDSWVNRRPDGKTLLYAASISAADVLDITDPAKPQKLQRIYDPEVGIQHETQINFTRDIIMTSDEYGGGAAGPTCGKSPTADATYMAPVVGAPQDYGALHFYKATETGLFSLEGVDKLGTFNIPFQQNSDALNGCTAHVYEQAPDANRLSIAWYGRGTRIVDFSEMPPKQIGYFIPTDANTWSAKPHRGYIFTSDLARGMDVLQFTGEGWPKTAGPAEVVRAAEMGRTLDGAPAPKPVAPAGGNNAAPTPTGRQIGRFTVRFRKGKVPGSKRKKSALVVTVYDAANRVVARAKVRKRGGRLALRLTGTGEVGGYKYFVRRGKKVLAKGGFSVKPTAGAKLAANRRMALRAR